MYLWHTELDGVQIHAHLVGGLHLHHSVLLGQEVGAAGFVFTALFYIIDIGTVAIDVGDISDDIADVGRRRGCIDLYLHASLDGELEAGPGLRQVCTQAAGVIPAKLVLQQDAVLITIDSSVSCIKYWRIL